MADDTPTNTVAVTGASGFVGSHVCEELLAHGYSVRACLRSEKKAGHLLELEKKHPSGKLEICLADMSIRGSYDAIFENCSTVFHVAGNFGTDYHTLWKTTNTARSPIPIGRLPPVDRLLREEKDDRVGPSYDHAVYESYLTPMKYLLESISKNSNTIRKVVYTSSGAAGETIVCDGGGSESHILENAYGRAKHDCERLLYNFCRDSAQHSIAGLSVCPCIVLGPLMGTVHDSVYQHRWSDMLRARYELHDSWAIADVRDIAVAHRLIAEQDHPNGTRVWIGSDPCWDIRELLEWIAKHQSFTEETRLEALRVFLADHGSSSGKSESEDESESNTASDSSSCSSTSSYGISAWDRDEEDNRTTTWSDPNVILKGYSPIAPKQTIMDTTRSVLHYWKDLGREYSLKEACDYYTVAEMDGCAKEMEWLEHHRIRKML